MSKKKIWFYLTQHGYGHCVRSLELIKNILDNDPNVEIEIRTGIPKTLISQNREFVEKIKLGSLYLVTKGGGIEQYSQFTITDAEIDLTANIILSFIKGEQSDFVYHEANLAKQNKVDLIMGDIPHYTFEISSQSGIPGIGFSDFLWHNIYKPYEEINQKFIEINKKLEESYQKMDLLITYEPLMNSIGSIQVKKINLPSQKVTKDPEYVKDILGIDKKKIIVMAAIRAPEFRFSFEFLRKFKDVQFISYQNINNFYQFNIDNVDVNYIDVINASDLVIGKPGYSIFTNLIEAQKPFLSISREGFIEDRLLIKLMKKHLPFYLDFDREDFLSGEWDYYIDMFMNHKTKENSQKLKTNGYDQAVKIIKGYLR